MPSLSSLSTSASCLHLPHRDWDEIFSRNQQPNSRHENAPFLNLEENNEIVRAFMESSSSSSPYEVNMVAGFCSGANLTSQTTRIDNANPVAWIDDRSRDTDGNCRSRTLSLNPQALYQQLKNKRFETTQDDGPSEEPDVDRRLIFMPDPSPQGVMILASTATCSEADALRTFIYRYLAFKPYLGVHIVGNHFATFQLSFSLPYFAWRQSSSPFEDHRTSVDGVHLRRCKDLSFLRMTTQPPESTVSDVDYLYEAHVSAVVTGQGRNRWVAYGFADTYFEPEDTRESLEAYNEELTEDGILLDPLSRGTLDAQMPIWEPRAYFWRVLQARISQVAREWYNTVEMLQQRVDCYIEENRLPHSFSTTNHSQLQFQQCYDWSIRVRRLVKDLSQSLSMSLRTWDGFLAGDIKEFLNAEPNTNDNRQLLAVKAHFDRLRTVSYQLELLSARCENFVGDFKLSLALAEREFHSCQHMNAERNQVITFIALVLISPVALSALVFSAEVFPAPGSITPFFGLILSFMVTLWAAVIVVPKGWRKTVAINKIVRLHFEPYLTAFRKACSRHSLRDDSGREARLSERLDPVNSAQASWAISFPAEAFKHARRSGLHPFSTRSQHYSHASETSQNNRHSNGSSPANEKNCEIRFPSPSVTNCTTSPSLATDYHDTIRESTGQNSHSVGNVEPNIALNIDCPSVSLTHPGFPDGNTEESSDRQSQWTNTESTFSTNASLQYASSSINGYDDANVSDDEEEDVEGDNWLETTILGTVSGDLALAASLISSLPRHLMLDARSGSNVCQRSPAVGETGSRDNYRDNGDTSKRSRKRKKVSDSNSNEDKSDEDGENGDDQGRQNSNSGNQHVSEGVLPLLSCPFHKRDRVKYGIQHVQTSSGMTSRDYRTCAGPGFKTIQRLKEHLKRNHSPVQCDRCYRIFEGPDRTTCMDKLTEHRQLEVSCERGDPAAKEGISDAQWLGIKQKRKKNQEAHRVQVWFEIWSVIFPGVAKPETPWYDASEPKRAFSRTMSGEHFAKMFIQKLMSTGKNFSPADLELLKKCAQDTYETQASLVTASSSAGLTSNETLNHQSSMSSLNTLSSTSTGFSGIGIPPLIDCTGRTYFRDTGSGSDVLGHQPPVRPPANSIPVNCHPNQSPLQQRWDSPGTVYPSFPIRADNVMINPSVQIARNDSSSYAFDDNMLVSSTQLQNTQLQNTQIAFDVDVGDLLEQGLHMHQDDFHT